MSTTPHPDNTAEHTALSELVDSPYTPPPAAETPPTPPVKKRRRGLWLFIVFLLLMTGGSSYFAYQLWLQLRMNQSQHTTHTQHSNAASDALQHSITALQEQWQAVQPLHNEYQEQIAALQQEQQQLQQAYVQIYNKLRRVGDREDWSIAEVGYLLRIAQQRLSLGNDVPAALDALEAADQRLRSAGPVFLKVREQLAKDIQQLQRLEPPDIEGIALRLAGYAQSSEALPLLQGYAQPSASPPKAADPPADDSHTYDWQDIGQTVWGEMRKLVVVRYNDSADVGLLSPQQGQILSHHLRVKLDTARLLVLTRDTEQFKLEIKALQDRLKRYYDLNNVAVQAMQAALKDMEDIELQLELPDISKSLAELEYLDKITSDDELSLINSDATQVTP